jgi:hypothetical protein
VDFVLSPEAIASKIAEIAEIAFASTDSVIC